MSLQSYTHIETQSLPSFVGYIQHPFRFQYLLWIIMSVFILTMMMYSLSVSYIYPHNYIFQSGLCILYIFMLQGRKRGRPSKQSTSRLKKQKDNNPPWIGRWIIRKKIRKNGKQDVVRSLFSSLILLLFSFSNWYFV